MTKKWPCKSANYSPIHVSWTQKVRTAGLIDESSYIMPCVRPSNDWIEGEQQRDLPKMRQLVQRKPTDQLGRHNVSLGLQSKNFERQLRREVD